MRAQTANLFLLRDLDDSSRTRSHSETELSALRAVADWIQTFVAKPHKDLGRCGPVCPFVPRALEHNTLWLAPERIASRSVEDVVQLMNDYRALLLREQPVEGDGANNKAIVVVLSDVPTDRAADYLRDDRIQQLKRLSYAEDGVVVGEFHARNDGTAIRNPGFQPFRAPAPFLLMRPTVIDDWMFFLDNEDWLSLWARRFGESAVHALAERLRRTKWRQVDSDTTDCTSGVAIEP